VLGQPGTDSAAIDAFVAAYKPPRSNDDDYY
jgi:hypothetical protein